VKKVFLAIIALVITAAAQAQVESHVRWSYASKKTSATEAVVFIKATIDNGWHIYSQHVKSGGPLPTEFTFTPSNQYKLVGKTIEPKPISKYEKVFKMDVGYFENTVIFKQYIKFKAGSPVVKGKLEFLACSNHCLPPDEVAFTIPIV
jgi:DsbC/DsbD-like thiol-disulfide interchange protein